MPVPFILGGLAILGGGLFIGSQIDDAVERPPASGTIPGQVTPQSLFSFTNILKVTLLTGSAYLAYETARKVGLV